MFLIANEPIKVIALPKISRATELLIDFAGRESFPALQYFLERPNRVLDEKCMHMVRHHRKCNHCYSLTFEMAQGISNNVGAVGRSQQAGTVTSI